jgi:hypothetical protein
VPPCAGAVGVERAEGRLLFFLEPRPLRVVRAELGDSGVVLRGQPGAARGLGLPGGLHPKDGDAFRVREGLAFLVALPLLNVRRLIRRPLAPGRVQLILPAAALVYVLLLIDGLLQLG